MTAFVTLTDQSYFNKALQTIHELRHYGQWQGDIILIAVDFEPKIENVIIHPIKHIDHLPLWEEWKRYPIKRMDDNRHYGKFYQWDKLQVFTSFFKQWERIIFLDAGMRVCSNVNSILSIDYKDQFIAPDDSTPGDNGNRLKVQFDLEANKITTQLLHYELGKEWLEQKYFINCIFMFDTNLITDTTLDELKMLMYKYPISLCNEMGIMNLYFNVKHKVWTALPEKIDGYLYGWCELNYPEKPTWKDFTFIKYSVTMS